MMIKKYFIAAILIVVFAIAGIFLPRNPNSPKEVIFHIERGDNSRTISSRLVKEGLIWWGPLFNLYVFVTGKNNQLQAGSYLLSPSMNMLKIAEKIASGDITKAIITIPEGFTSEQIYERLSITFLVGTRSVLDELKNYEGYLFPDTYEIKYGAGSEDIIKIMTNNFYKKTAGLKITPEVIVMASILEKEVKTKEEKELVSGILWKRLRVGIPLQVDAYMWTYENYGLPEKPISNPGIESILAAMEPKESQFWYYLSTPEGKTIFSRTLEEHNITKAKYLE